jgi:hypothetical protein
VNVIVAPAVSEPATAAVKVVVPHPDLETGGDTERTKLGRTRLTLSATLNTMLREKRKVIEVPAAVTGFAKVSWLSVTAGAGCMIAGEAGMATAVMSLAAAIVTAAVRVARFAGCAKTLVVTPVGILIEHSVLAKRRAVFAVSVIFASAAAEFAVAVSNVVVPHPVVVDVGVPVTVKYGSTITIASFMAMSTLALNSYETDDAVEVVAFPTTSLLATRMGAMIAGDVGIAVAAISVPSARVTSMVLYVGFADCGVGLVVTPVATLIVHCTSVAKAPVPTVNEISAFDVPENCAAVVKVAVSHPLTVVDASVPSTNCGITIVMESPTDNFVFKAKLKLIGVVADVMVVPTSRRLVRITASLSA